MSDWIANLNPEQAQAVMHDQGPLLILAGAGSGKTTVLVSRAGRLVSESGVDPERLCVMTFTNKAARELKSRVSQRLGKQGQKIWAGTFHSFGLRILKTYHKAAGLPKEFGILDPKDTGNLVRELIADFNYEGKNTFDSEKLLEMIGQWRAKGQTEATRENDYEAAVEWLLPKYVRRLEVLAAVDFDSLILLPFELMRDNEEVCQSIQNTFDHVMVDEFQDTNDIQMRLTSKLVETHRNITVVGDDDQSIYGWRGACIRNILDFPKHYDGCRVVKLERNYRSTPEILEMANAVISKNSHRHMKTLRPGVATHQGEKPGIFVAEDENEESEYICSQVGQRLAQGMVGSDIAVLYRSNGLGAFLEAELRKNHILYSISGGTAFFDRKETRDILAYLRCSLRPTDMAFRRIINTPNRGIGEKTLHQISQKVRDVGGSMVSWSKDWRRAEVDSRPGESIDDLFSKLDSLAGRILGGGKPGDQLLTFLDEIGYRGYLQKQSRNSSSATRRWKFVELFADVLTRFVERGGNNRKALREFVDAMELRDVNDDDQDAHQKVQLMTLHACKGLEFPTVFLAGVEEDLIPHKTLGTDVAEERRLFYVGLTRAKKELVLTRAKKRRRFNKWSDTVPSRFLLEIPDHLIRKLSGVAPASSETRRSMVADLFKKLDALDNRPAPPKEDLQEEL